MRNLRLTKERAAAIREAIKRRVEHELPEDEHDHTADWVYDEAIQEAWKRGVIDAVEAFEDAVSSRVVRFK